MDSSNQQQKNIFIAVENEGTQMENDAKALTNLLENCGNHKLIVKFEFISNENHASIFHQAVYNGFKMVKGDAIKK